MDKILRDPIAPSQKKNGTYPWSYKAPTKDEAHSGNLSAGNYYGTGYKAPFGKTLAKSLEEGPIPQKSRCFALDEIFKREDKKG